MDWTTGHVCRPASRGWRWLKLGSLAVLGLVVGLAGFGYLWGVRAVRYQVLQRVMALGERLGRPVTVERVLVSPHEIFLGGLHISTPDGAVLHVDETRLAFDPFRALAGDRRPRSVHLRGMELHLPLHPAPGGPIAELLDRLRRGGGPSGAADGAPAALHRRRLPPIDVADARVVVHDDTGVGVARAVVDDGRIDDGTEGRPTELRLEAAGRFIGGDEGLPRTGWRVETTLERSDGAWELALDFGEPVPLPVDALPGVPDGTRVWLGSLRAGSDGALRLSSLRAELPASLAGPLGAATVAAKTLTLDVPEGIPARPSAWRTILRSARTIEAEDVHVSAPRLAASGGVRVLNAQLGPPSGTGWLPAVEQVTVTALRASLHLDPEVLLGASLPSPAAVRARLFPSLPAADAPADTDAPGDTAPAPVEAAAPAEAPACLPIAPLRALLGRARRLVGSAGLALIDGRVDVSVPEDEGLVRLHVADLEMTLDRREEGLARDFAAQGRLGVGEEDGLRFAVHGQLPDQLSAGGWPLPRELRLSGPWLAAGLAWLDPRLGVGDHASASLLLELPERWEADRLAVAGQIELRGLTLDHPAIARIPLEDLRLSMSFDLSWDRPGDRLALRLDPISAGSTKATLDLVVERMSGRPRIVADLDVPRQPCNGLLHDIPPALIPRLEGAELAGTITFRVKSEIDLAEPIAFGLDITGDWSQCRVVTLGPHVEVERLLGGDFVHQIWEHGERTDITVGPGASGYVTLDQIPVPVRQAALATEDMAFYRHEGFRPTLLSRAIRLNLRRGRYVYGGSTISQQLVKNLFLSREKTLSRKLEEAIITWHMERVLPKKRILELYLNCIEYGPRIYGIRKASYTYFGVHPSALTPLEGAFLMGLKPAPRSGYTVYRRRRFRRWWRQKMDRIMHRLWRDMGAISEEQYRKAAPYVPLFFYPGEGYVRPRAAGLPESALAPPPEVPPLPPRSEGKHGELTAPAHNP